MEATQDLSSVLRTGRKRRQALAPQDLAELADEVAESERMNDEDQDEIEALQMPDPVQYEQELEPENAAHADSNIWMATLTPKASERNQRPPSRTPTRNPKSRSPAAVPEEPERPQESQEAEVEPYDDGDYGYLAPAYSDVSSADDDGEPEPEVVGSRDMDTIAQGEDFSMIFMDSIPSLHDMGQQQPTHYEEMGEETSIIINNTLESIRRGTVLDEEQDLEPVEEEEIDQGESEDAEEGVPVQDELDDDDESEDVGIEIATDQESDEGDEDAEGEEEGAVPERVIQPTPTPSPKARRTITPSSRHSSRSRQSEPSPARRSFSRSPEPTILQPPIRPPKKALANSPLRQRVLKNQAVEAAPPTSLSAEESLFVREELEQPSYEDSFSEIPQEVLEAATPRKDTSRLGYTPADAYVGTVEENVPLHYEEVAIHSLPEEQVEERYEQDDAYDEVDGIQADEEHADDYAAEDAIGEFVELAEQPSSDDDMAAEEEIAEVEQHGPDVEEEYEGAFDDIPAEVDMMDIGELEVEEVEAEIEETPEPEAINLPVTLVLESEPHEENLYDDNEEAEEEEDDDDEALELDEAMAEDESEGEPRAPILQEQRSSPRQRLAVTIEKSHSAQQTPGSFRGHRRQLSASSPLEAMGLSPRQPPQITIAHPSSTPVKREQASRSVSRSASSIDATPRNRIPSPMQSPQSVQHEQSSHDRSLRPLLSATVRAGRALQSVTSDPPSPDAGDRLLRSPFQSSGGKESRHGSNERQTVRVPSKSPIRSREYRSTPAPVNRDGQVDLSRVSPRSNSSPEANLEPTSATHAVPSPRNSQTSSVRQSPQSEGAMSWVAQEGPISPRLRGDNSLRNVYGPPTPRAVAAVRNLPPQVDSATEEVGDAVQEEAQDKEGSVPRDDETDIWEFEARRSTPKASRSQPFGASAAMQSARKRGGIPSPWTRKTRQNLAGLGTTASSGNAAGSRAVANRAIHPVLEAAESEEYSLLARRQAVEDAEKGQSSAVKGGKFDLSSFFSSPAAIPGMLAEKFFPAGSRPAEQEAQPPMSQIQTTSLFPPLVSSSRPSPMRPASFAKSTPLRPRRDDVDTTPTPRARPRQESQEQQQQQYVALRLEEPSPEIEMSPEKSEDELEIPQLMSDKLIPPSLPVVISEPTPEPEPAAEPEIPVVAQKQNFTPRSNRQSNNSFFQGSSARAAAATPPRMQLSHDDIRRWQQEMSSASDESVEFVKPFLRPLPPKNASPRKSSLRSPLKPHTPGRVVEFTSSVLSPLEQARARHQRRLSQSTNNSYTGSNKENTAGSVSSGAPSTPRSVSVPVSQTMWTRQHWLFLDWLIQIRREGPFDEDYDHSADKFLGKAVRAQGMAMILERWHLDCVDAFKAEVGGWEEGYLVKRLFALLLGEERRVRSEEEQQIMFH